MATTIEELIHVAVPGADPARLDGDRGVAFEHHVPARRPAADGDSRADVDGDARECMTVRGLELQPRGLELAPQQAESRKPTPTETD
jgi:hypothetical protein